MGISGTIAARGLKFWLKVALSAPIVMAWTEIRIREIWIFQKFFFCFFVSTDLLGTQVHPPDVPESPNPDPEREIRFFKNRNFSFFWLFKLKDPTIWASIDSPGPTLDQGGQGDQGDQGGQGGRVVRVVRWSAWSGMSAWTQGHMPYLMIYT